MKAARKPPYRKPRSAPEAAATSRTMSEAFDKWLDDYTNDPSAFRSIESIATEHVLAKLKGDRSTYGMRCEIILHAYMGVPLK